MHCNIEQQDKRKLAFSDHVQTTTNQVHLSLGHALAVRSQLLLQFSLIACNVHDEYNTTNETKRAKRASHLLLDLQAKAVTARTRTQRATNFITAWAESKHQRKAAENDVK